MATKLTKPVTRALKVKDANNIEGEICVTMTAGGIQFWKGRRKLNVIPWAEIGRLSTLPLNSPARFAGNNLGWLVELSKDDAPAESKLAESKPVVSAVSVQSQRTWDDDDAAGPVPVPAGV